MKSFTFYKYQGTGNDFVMIDNRNNQFNNKNISLIKQLCDRKYGVGADGLIVIENHQEVDFNLIYFNADGSKSFCGNGSRCGVAFANFLGIITTTTTFNAIDGLHKAKIEGTKVFLKMNDVNVIENTEKDFYLNTGSPHYIVYKDNILNLDIVKEAHQIRYNNRFKDEGTNVNFVTYKNGKTTMRTYERGVENETLSCGTGATAVALTTHLKHNVSSPAIVHVKGGELTISFKRKRDNYFHDIWLIGETKQVFKGEITL